MPDFWEQAREELDGLPGGRGLNIAHEAVDRHATGPRADHLALRWLGKNGEVRDFTFAALGRETSRFANVLQGLGLGKGDLVGVLAGRIPELYVAALGTLKNRSVFSPLFSAFGPEPIQTRLEIGHAKALLTTDCSTSARSPPSAPRCRSSSTSSSSARAAPRRTCPALTTTGG